MKAMHYLHKIASLTGAVLLLASIFAAINGIAQQQYYQSASKGYYKVFTQFDTRNTIVRFYNRNDELMYEESIQGKYIKMTKRNVRLLNRTLGQFNGSGLVASSVKATTLQADTRPDLNTVPNQVLRDELKVEKAACLAAKSRIHMSMHPLIRPGKFKLLFDNPQQKKIRILLRDDRGFTVYEENSSIDKYNRDFDLVGMQSGTL